MALLGAEKGFQVDGLTAALRQRAQVSRTNSVIDDYNQLLEKFSYEVVRRKVEQAAEAARLAQFKLLETQSPGAPCLTLSDQRFKDGRQKTLARLHFEEVFRVEARKLGVPEIWISHTLGK